MPSEATRRRTSAPATTFSAPSSQPPFGTESRWPPDEDGAVGLAGEREPLVPGCVDRLDGAALGQQPSEPLARTVPGLGPGDSLRSRRVARELAQLLQLGHGSRPVESHGPTLTGDFACGMLSRMQSRIVSIAARVAVLGLVLVALWALWEGYRWLWIETGWTKPFVVNATTMPHLHDIVGALFEPIREGEPLLVERLLDAALFTAKEAAVGFAIGATIGFLLGAVIAHFAVLQRGVMPYVVASQTIPILAVAPIVVVGLGSVEIFGWTPTDWVRVSVIAAYLTFFPVTVNTVRGLRSADPAAVELMESYAASEWSVFWKLRVPAALPFLFSAFKVAATACVVGAIIGELPSSIQSGLGGWIINFNQYYALEPENLWATNLIAALLGIAFFLVVVLAEKLLVHRAPEQLV